MRRASPRSRYNKRKRIEIDISTRPKTLDIEDVDFGGSLGFVWLAYSHGYMNSVLHRWVWSNGVSDWLFSAAMSTKSIF